MIRAYENIQKLLRVKLYNNCKIFEKYLILSFVYFLETSISHNYSPSSLTSFLFYFSLLLTSRLFPRQLEREVHFTYIRTHTQIGRDVSRTRDFAEKFRSEVTFITSINRGIIPFGTRIPCPFMSPPFSPTFSWQCT